jgi:hypothetical protein
VALTLSRISRREHPINVAAVFAKAGIDPLPTVTGADVALLPKHTFPTSATTWTAAAFSAGVATVLLAGPDATSSGAVVVSADADLWLRVTSTPEVRITVLGANQQLVVTPPSGSTLALVDSGLVDSSTIAA